MNIDEYQSPALAFTLKKHAHIEIKCASKKCDDIHVPHILFPGRYKVTYMQNDLVTIQRFWFGGLPLGLKITSSAEALYKFQQTEAEHIVLKE